MLLSQSINQRLFEEILQVHTSLVDDGEPSHRETTEGEANALRYAAGYVLKKKLSHRPEFVQCLHQSGEGDSYIEYTKKWIELVNRGKLFKVNDETYRFFQCLPQGHFLWLWASRSAKATVS